MARRKRRVRIPLGFGGAGRAGLLGSLLPTAAEMAEAARIRRQEINDKIASFNREETSFEELEAYLNEKIAAATGEEASTLRSLLADARAADKKRQNNKLATDVKNAVADFQNGSATYADTVALLDSARTKSTDAELTGAINRYRADVNRLNTQREVNTKVEEFNKGRVKYDELVAFVQGKLATETNDLVRTELNKTLDGARAAENARVMEDAQEAYMAGRIGIEEFTARLDALRSDPSQKDTEQIEAINAAIGAAEANEQALIDMKMYTDWQVGRVSDAAALDYFTSRQATEKNPKTSEAMGKYAANVQSKIEQTNQRAASLGRRVASGVSSSATAAKKQRDDDAKAAFAAWQKEAFVPMLEAANGDRQTILDLFAARAQYIAELRESVGFDQGMYDRFLRDNDDYAAAALAQAAQMRFDNQVRAAVEPIGVPRTDVEGVDTPGSKQNVIGWDIDDKASDFDVARAMLRIARAAQQLYSSPDALPGQKTFASMLNDDSLMVAHKRVKDMREASGAFKTTAQSLWEGLQAQRAAGTPGVGAFLDQFKGGLKEFAEKVQDRELLGSAYRLAQRPGAWSVEAQQKFVEQATAQLGNIRDTRVEILGEGGPTPAGQLEIDLLQAMYPNSFLTIVANLPGIRGQTELVPVFGDVITGANGQPILDFNGDPVREVLGYEENLEAPDAMRRAQLALRAEQPRVPLTVHDPIESALSQPFMGAEHENHPDDRMLITDDTGFPRWLPMGTGGANALENAFRPIIPVSPDPTKVIGGEGFTWTREDGTPMNAEELAFALIRANLGVPWENAVRAAGEHSMWWGEFLNAKRANDPAEAEAAQAPLSISNVSRIIGDGRTVFANLFGKDRLEIVDDFWAAIPVRDAIEGIIDAGKAHYDPGSPQAVARANMQEANREALMTGWSNVTGFLGQAWQNAFNAFQGAMASEAPMDEAFIRQTTQDIWTMRAINPPGETPGAAAPIEGSPEAAFQTPTYTPPAYSPASTVYDQRGNEFNIEEFLANWETLAPTYAPQFYNPIPEPVYNPPAPFDYAAYVTSPAYVPPGYSVAPIEGSPEEHFSQFQVPVPEYNYPTYSGGGGGDHMFSPV